MRAMEPSNRIQQIIERERAIHMSLFPFGILLGAGLIALLVLQ